MKHYIAATALAILSSTAASAATFQYFTDRTAFEDAIGDSISYDLTSPGTLLSVTGFDVSIDPSGTVDDIINLNNDPDTQLGFGLPLVGFGANFDLSPSGLGSGIAVTVSTSSGDFQLGSEIPRTAVGGFFGFISDTFFDAITFSEGTQGCCQETYSFSNPIGALNLAPVPLPAGLPLMLGALGAFAVFRRKSRTV